MSSWACDNSLHAASRLTEGLSEEAGSGEDATPALLGTLSLVDLAGSERISNAALEDAHQRVRVLEVMHPRDQTLAHGAAPVLSLAMGVRPCRRCWRLLLLSGINDTACPGMHWHGHHASATHACR